MSRKVNTGKLIDNNMVVTTLLLITMFAMYLIQQGYFSFNAFSTVRIVTWVICILAFALGIVFLILGFKKKDIFFELSAWCGGLAILTMLMKINFEIKALQINIPNFRIIKFVPIVMGLISIYILVSWIYIVYQVIIKNK